MMGPLQSLQSSDLLGRMLWGWAWVSSCAAHCVLGLGFLGQGLLQNHRSRQPEASLPEKGWSCQGKDLVLQQQLRGGQGPGLQSQDWAAQTDLTPGEMQAALRLASAGSSPQISPPPLPSSETRLLATVWPSQRESLLQERAQSFLPAAARCELHISSATMLQGVSTLPSRMFEPSKRTEKILCKWVMQVPGRGPGSVLQKLLRAAGRESRVGG